MLPWLTEYMGSLGSEKECRRVAVLRVASRDRKMPVLWVRPETTALLSLLKSEIRVVVVFETCRRASCW